MKALLLVGLQNDLLPGSAPAPRAGDAIIPLVNEIQGAFRLVVATQQWHPANHRSFAAVQKGRVAGEQIKVGKLHQVLKAVHCVQYTRGAELASALNLTRVNKVIRLGTDADHDDESAFFDAGHRSTGLSDYLAEKKVTKLYLAGLGLEHVIKATALDAIGLGFKTCLVEDACQASDPHPDVAHNALEEMKSAGVSLEPSGTLSSPRVRKAAR